MTHIRVRAFKRMRIVGRETLYLGWVRENNPFWEQGIWKQTPPPTPRSRLWSLTWNGSSGAKACQSCPEISASCWHQVGSPQVWSSAKSEAGLQVQCVWGGIAQGPCIRSSLRWPLHQRDLWTWKQRMLYLRDGTQSSKYWKTSYCSFLLPTIVFFFLLYYYFYFPFHFDMISVTYKCCKLKEFLHKPLCTVESASWCSHYGKQYGVSLKKCKIELQ